MKGKILLALTLLLGASTTIWAVGNSGKANQKKHAYTNEDVWAAYEGFNNTLLDSNKYIYKTNSSYPVLLTVAMEQRLSGVSLFIGIWQ